MGPAGFAEGPSAPGAGPAMDRRKKPLDVTASSVSAGGDAATGSAFFPPPRVSAEFVSELGDPGPAPAPTGTGLGCSRTGNRTHFLSSRSPTLAPPSGRVPRRHSPGVSPRAGPTETPVQASASPPSCRWSRSRGRCLLAHASLCPALPELTGINSLARNQLFVSAA